MHVIHHIIFLCLFCFLLSYGDYRDLHVLTHSFPTLCSSDLQIAYFHEAAALGELFNGISPLQQYALITINIGQAGFATWGRSKARIKGENASVCVKLPDIQHIRSHGSRHDRKRVVSGTGVSVSVDMGGLRVMQKEQYTSSSIGSIINSNYI